MILRNKEWQKLCNRFLFYFYIILLYNNIPFVCPICCGGGFSGSRVSVIFNHSLTLHYHFMKITRMSGNRSSNPGNDMRIQH